MGNRVATTQNGYERIEHTIAHVVQVALHIDHLIDQVDDDVASYIMTALCADAAALGSRLCVFSLQYKEQLECISIDPSNRPTA